MCWRGLPHLVLCLVIPMAACREHGPTATAGDVPSPDFTHVTGHPVTFGISGVLPESVTGLWADGTPWTAVVSFDPDLIVDGFKYEPVEWTFEIDGETITTASAALNVEPVWSSYQYVDEGNPWTGTLKGSAVFGMALNFGDTNGDQLGPGFDVTEPLDLSFWESHNGSIGLVDLGVIEHVEVQCFGVYRAPPVTPGRPDEPGRPDQPGSPDGAGPPCVT